MTTEAEHERQGRVVVRAQAIINALLMTKSTREALIELVGDEATARYWPA